MKLIKILLIIVSLAFSFSALAAEKTLPTKKHVEKALVFIVTPTNSVSITSIIDKWLSSGYRIKSVTQTGPNFVAQGDQYTETESKYLAVITIIIEKDE